MARHRCFITTCSQDIVQRILEHLSFQDKARLSLTCKALMNHHMAGPLDIRLAKQGQAQRRSLRTLIHLLEDISAEQRCKIRELCMHSGSCGIAKLPDSRQHRICRALIENLTVLRLHNVYMRLEVLEVPGIELKLEVLDLTGSILVAKANPKTLEWPLLTSNSPTLMCLTLRGVLVHVPKMEICWGRQILPFEHVILPALVELDITDFGVTDCKPFGNQYFEEGRAGVCRRTGCFISLQSFKDAPNLKTLRFSPSHEWKFAASTWQYFANLRSAELIQSRYGPYLEHLPLSLKEFTVRLWPLSRGEHSYDYPTLVKDFKHIVKASNAGTRLEKLTVIGFTHSDVCSYASKWDGLCLPGISELVLEPSFSEKDLVALENTLDDHPWNQVLHTFPDLEKLHVGGQHIANFRLSMPCPLLEELSLNFCPASIIVDCAKLHSLSLEHRFSNAPPQRAAEVHELDMSVWVCGQVASLSVVLKSYRKKDTFRVRCKPGKSIDATFSYPAEQWGEWVIGVRLAASSLGQSGHRAAKFVCTSSHGMLAWGLA